MALRFDATLKALVQAHPEDWLAVLGERPSGPVRVLTPDLSTVTAFADTVLEVGDDLVHVDFQTGADAALPRRLLLYNALLHERYELPVHSAVVLLRRQADHSNLTGQVRYEARPGRGGLDFRFEVVRLWQVPAADLLAGGLGTLPLAPLGQLPPGQTPEEALPGVIQRLAERFEAEAPAEAATLLTSTFVLLGLRLPRDRAATIFQGVRAMRESSTYQLILDEGRAEGLAKGRMEGRVEGRAEGARETLLRQGRVRFGPPDEPTRTALGAVADFERLERMSERIFVATDWRDLLATP